MEGKWRAVIQENVQGGWLISSDQIKVGRLLGQGAFGATFLGKYEDQEVAVKQLKMESSCAQDLFLRELHALQTVESQYISCLIGVVIEPPKNFWLVSEFYQGGTLKKWIHQPSMSSFPWRSSSKRSLAEKIDMCLKIAQGMQALEVMSPPVMHRDLKPSNILLDRSQNPKIADFGLSRSFNPAHQATHTQETGSYLHMSPEMLKSEPYGPKTDVFSFATIMSEVFTQKAPFQDTNLTPFQAAVYMADKGGRPRLPKVSPQFPAGLETLIQKCWETDANSRPSFAEIVTALEGIKAQCQ